MHVTPLILVLSLLALFPSPQVTKEKPGARPTGADDRISITVDKIERAAQFPKSLRESGMTYSAAAAGCDYVIVHVSIVGKKDLKVALEELRLSEPNSPHLVDDLGEKYWALMAQYNATRGFHPLGEGGYIVFQVPTQIAPVQLKFIYPYRDEADPSRSIRYGQVDVQLSRPRLPSTVREGRCAWPGYGETVAAPVSVPSALPIGAPPEVHVTNAYGFPIKAGLRSGGRGLDFIVPANGSASRLVPPGKYSIYFQFGADPESLYAGDDFAADFTGVEIRLKESGDYHIRRIK